MKKIVDQLGRTITYPYPPKRIISLCPAITETMYHLNLDMEIVGRTRFCIHPQDKVKNAINVGGTKEIKLDRIHELKPDLIIAEKEENTKEIVAVLEQHYPVYVFEIQTIGDALRMIEDLGKLTDRDQESVRLKNEIQEQFKTLHNTNGKRVAYVIWKNPYMVVGKDTYIQSLLDKMDFVNPFTSLEGRYPSVTIEDLQNASLDYLLLASEPFPFREKHVNEFKSLLPNVQSIIVDGEMFWYGAKMVEAVAYLNKMFT